MIHRVLGTAGHIDHGKTALIRALTGVNTDRLLEEQRRGITIELGFAPLQLGDGSIVGVVDVPGHERFIRTMLAGAGGIDAVLLVIAADESIKPQTREHFDICRLLGVQGGVVALTKKDLVDDELLELARDELAEWLSGTFLENAPVVPVSSVTGEGLERLRAVIESTMRDLPVPRRPDFARLPVDRSFTMKGFGAVITGTLLSGRVRAGDVLVSWPGGEPLRVRRVQVHGTEVVEASSGQRTALNVTAEGRPPARGEFLAATGRVAASSLLDVWLEMLPAAPRALENNDRVHVHLGTAKRDARVRILGGAGALPPATSGWVQLRLAAPLAATVGDRFIIRWPSPGVTLGGGRVADPAPGKHRAGDVDAVALLERLDSGDAADRLQALLDEAGERGLTAEDLVVRSGRSLPGVTELVAELRKQGRALAAGSPLAAALSAAARDSVSERLQALLRDFHADRPLDSGMSLAELRRKAAPSTLEPLVEAVLRHVTAAGRVIIDGERIGLATHAVRLEPAEESAVVRVRAAMQAGGLDPPDPEEILRRDGIAADRASALLRLLQRRGELVRIGEGYVVDSRVLEDLKHRLWQRRGGEPLIDVRQFKEIAGVTRRRAIPLLEFLDAERVTTRRGDARFIQPPPAGAGS